MKEPHAHVSVGKTGHLGRMYVQNEGFVTCKSHKRDMFSSHVNSSASNTCFQKTNAHGRCNIFACTHTGIARTVSMLN